MTNIKKMQPNPNYNPTIITHDKYPRILSPNSRAILELMITTDLNDTQIANKLGITQPCVCKAKTGIEFQKVYKQFVNSNMLYEAKRVTKALVESASDPRYQSSADRKTYLEAVGLLRASDIDADARTDAAKEIHGASGALQIIQTLVSDGVRITLERSNGTLSQFEQADPNLVEVEPADDIYNSNDNEPETSVKQARINARVTYHKQTKAKIKAGRQKSGFAATKAKA